MQMSLVCVMMNTSHIKALSNKERSRHQRANVKKSTLKQREQLMRLLKEDTLGARSIDTIKPSDASPIYPITVNCKTSYSFISFSFSK